MWTSSVGASARWWIGKACGILTGGGRERRSDERGNALRGCERCSTRDGSEVDGLRREPWGSDCERDLASAGCGSTAPERVSRRLGDGDEIALGVNDARCCDEPRSQAGLSVNSSDPAVDPAFC